MFFFRFRKNDYIIDINTNKITKRIKQIIYLTLHVNRRIFISYDRYVKFFLFVIKYNNKFISIIQIYFSFIKKRNN